MIHLKLSVMFTGILAAVHIAALPMHSNLFKSPSPDPNAPPERVPSSGTPWTSLATHSTSHSAHAAPPNPHDRAMPTSDLFRRPPAQAPSTSTLGHQESNLEQGHHLLPQPVPQLQTWGHVGSTQGWHPQGPQPGVAALPSHTGLQRTHEGHGQTRSSTHVGSTQGSHSQGPPPGDAALPSHTGLQRTHEGHGRSHRAAIRATPYNRNARRTGSSQNPPLPLVPATIDTPRHLDPSQALQVPSRVHAPFTPLASSSQSIQGSTGHPESHVPPQPEASGSHSIPKKKRIKAEPINIEDEFTRLYPQDEGGPGYKCKRESCDRILKIENPGRHSGMPEAEIQKDLKLGGHVAGHRWKERNAPTQIPRTEMEPIKRVRIKIEEEYTRLSPQDKGYPGFQCNHEICGKRIFPIEDRHSKMSEDDMLKDLDSKLRQHISNDRWNESNRPQEGHPQ